MSKKKYTDSRIGKQPVVLPDKVEAKVDGNTVTVKGPKGSLTRTFVDVTIALEGKSLIVGCIGETSSDKAMHGLGRALLANMVTGVSTGYTRDLEVQGVGFRIELTGSKLKVSVGFSHPVFFDLPDGIKAEVPKAGTSLKVSGIDKELVGQTAAKIRGIRPPEPYKGKGIRYKGEKVRRKAGKAAGA